MEMTLRKQLNDITNCCLIFSLNSPRWAQADYVPAFDG